MKRNYETPVIEFEQYSLTTQVAGACRDAGKTPIEEVTPKLLDNSSVHCVTAGGTSKNCSDGAHTWTVSLTGTIFADGNKVGGCDHDVYNQDQYIQLLESSIGGSSISGGVVRSQKDGLLYFEFKGTGQGFQHTGSFEVADYANFFQS